jgi:protein-tyrosine phosphatase
MPLFRKVSVPTNASGQLLLSSMPGRVDGLEKYWENIKNLPVHAIVCLTSDEEIAKKSPTYLEAIRAATVPCARWPMPVPDYGVPDSGDEFLQLADRVAESLKQGDNVLIHCGAGIGRTGTFAVLVLMRLRVPLEKALGLVKTAGSGPENETQRAFLKKMSANTDG